MTSFLASHRVSVHYPPVPFSFVPSTDRFPSVFLAGTIDMGNSADWQTDVVNRFVVAGNVGAHILNPRRKDWDSSWKQSIDNPEFKAQVEWELEGITKADLVFFNFLPDSLSPVTLMELGYAASAKLPSTVIVCCPEEYWRNGNVEILCRRKALAFCFRDYEEAVAQLIQCC